MYHLRKLPYVAPQLLSFDSCLTMKSQIKYSWDDVFKSSKANLGAHFRVRFFPLEQPLPGCGSSDECCDARRKGEGRLLGIWATAIVSAPVLGDWSVTEACDQPSVSALSYFQSVQPGVAEDTCERMSVEACERWKEGLFETHSWDQRQLRSNGSLLLLQR